MKDTTPVLLKCKYSNLWCDYDRSGRTTYIKCFNINTTQEDKINCCKNDIECIYFKLK